MTKLCHPLRRTRFVELPADLRHPVRDGNDRAQRRHGSWAAQKFHKAAAKPGEHGFDVVIGRIEGKHGFRPRPAFLMSNGLLIAPCCRNRHKASLSRPQPYARSRPCWRHRTLEPETP